MEYRLLGGSGLKVPALSFGAATFGGGNEFFRAWGSTEVAEARRLIDVCLEAGVNFFDTADVYSDGLSEEILGEAIKGRRNKVLISTKSFYPIGEGANDAGSSRHHLIRACELTGAVLATLHNIRFYLDFMADLREGIRLGNLAAVASQTIGRYVDAASMTAAASNDGGSTTAST